MTITQGLAGPRGDKKKIRLEQSNLSCRTYITLRKNIKNLSVTLQTLKNIRLFPFMISSLTPLHNIFLCHIHNNTTSLINPVAHLIVPSREGTLADWRPSRNGTRELDEGLLHSPSSIAGEELIPGVQPP